MTRGTIEIGGTKADRDAFGEAIADAVEKVAFTGKPLSEREIDSWIRAHAELVIEKMIDFLPTAVRRIMNPKAPPTKPVLEFDGGRIRLWVLDAGQSIKLADHRSFHFGGDDTAGLVYQYQSHGNRAEENNIDDPETWEWIQTWMAKGMAYEAALKGLADSPDEVSITKAVEVYNAHQKQLASTGN